MAPPVYKPLTSAGGLTGAPNLPAEIFAPPADVTFDQVLAIQAQQRAQALQEQNAQIQIQNNEIALAEKQRQADEQRQLREAIARSSTPMTQATTETGQDVPDTLGGGTIDDTFDPNQTLDTVKRVLAQQGNLEGMLQVEKAQNDRKGYTPLSEAERAYAGQFLGAELPEGVSQSFVKDMGALYGKSQYAQALEDNRTKREEDKASLLPEGFEGNPTKKGSEIFNKAYAATNKVNTILDQLKESIQQTGPGAVSGPEYVRQKQLVGSLAQIMKGPEMLNLGASMAGGEASLLLTQLPEILAANGVGLGQFLVSQGLGRDPLDAIDFLKKRMNENLEIDGKAWNVRRVKSEDVGAPAGTKIPVVGDKAPFQVPNTTYQGIDKATGLPIFKRTRK